MCWKMISTWKLPHFPRIYAFTLLPFSSKLNATSWQLRDVDRPYQRAKVAFLAPIPLKDPGKEHDEDHTIVTALRDDARVPARRLVSALKFVRIDKFRGGPSPRCYQRLRSYRDNLCLQELLERPITMHFSLTRVSAMRRWLRHLPRILVDQRCIRDGETAEIMVLRKERQEDMLSWCSLSVSTIYWPNRERRWKMDSTWSFVDFMT